MNNKNTCRMFVAVLVIFGVTLCFSTVYSQQLTEKQARQVLVAQEPLADPTFSLASVDPSARKASEKVYTAQINALRQLTETRDQTLIPLLITYLNYTSNAAPPGVGIWRRGTVVDIERISVKFPAFAGIVSIPDADKVLATYILDTKNSLNSRFMAFHVLRYLNLTEFQSVGKVFDKEFLTSSIPVKRRLEAVENGTAPFDGTISLSTLEDN